MFRNGFCTEFSSVGETFHGSRLLFHAPGTVRERTGPDVELATPRRILEYCWGGEVFEGSNLI